VAGLTRRDLAAVTLSAPLACAGCSDTGFGDDSALQVDDQSGLNATSVSQKLDLDVADPGGASTLTPLVAAPDRRPPVCIGGARHSMGGQSLPPAEGVAVTFRPPALAVGPQHDVYTAGAGCRWRDVINQLDPLGLSPRVMQSNCDFSIGGSISVNAHGWAVPRGPLGSTVRRLRVMLADGSRIHCSPTEEPQLFSACIGGYGLPAAILDADLVPAVNTLLEQTAEVLAADHFGDRFESRVHEPGVEMAYGRLSMARSSFMQEALLVSHAPLAGQTGALPPARTSGELDGASRRLFRAQTGSDAGKRLRWWAETHLSPSRVATRNSLMNVSVRSFAPFDDRRTDILHEYFVPPAALNTFLDECRRLIPGSDQDLLNCTLRWVEADQLSLLTFAPEARIALVMLFTEEKTAAAEADMQVLTRSLIDAALSVGGSFYLPYRLHARLDQVKRAYPGLERFVDLKRRWDPTLRYRNQMWDAWMAAL
jgi:FAD/FMN-containing dehydrogenase